MGGRDTVFYLRLIEVQTGLVKLDVPRALPPSCLAFAPYGSNLMVGAWTGRLDAIDLADPSSPRRWRAKTLEQTTDIPDAWTELAHEGPVLGVGFSADGSKVFSVGSHNNVAMLRVWSFPGGEELRRVRRTGQNFSSFQLSADRSRLLLGTNVNTVEVYRLED